MPFPCYAILSLFWGKINSFKNVGVSMAVVLNRNSVKKTVVFASCQRSLSPY